MSAYNERGTYAVVDSSGKTLEKFRTINAANLWKDKNSKNYFEEISVIPL